MESKSCLMEKEKGGKRGEKGKHTLSCKEAIGKLRSMLR